MATVNIPVETLLDKVGALPSMPSVARRAVDIINDPKSSMSDLANVIKLDQSMSGLVLRWVNSAYYSLMQPVVTVEQAVMFLGYRMVQNLVLSAAVANFMSKPVLGYALERGSLWKHAIGTSAGARLIVQGIDSSQADDAYYAGLFCDVGKLALDVLLQKVNYVIRVQQKETYTEIEKRFFGYDHTEVSAALMMRWNLPGHLALVVQNHHAPANSDPKWRLLAYAVHVADTVMMMHGIGVGQKDLQYPIDPGAAEVLGWNEKSTEDLYQRIAPMIDEVEKFLNS